MRYPLCCAAFAARFGNDTDEDFQAWAIACSIGHVATAGNVAYPLPLYTNAAPRAPLNGDPTDRGLNFSSGLEVLRVSVGVR